MEVLSLSCHDKFERFRFFVLPTNVSGAVNIVLSATPVTLAAITIGADCDDAVSLAATIGLQETSAVAAENGVLFKIWRDSTLLFSAYRSLFGSPNKTIVSFTHVDSDPVVERHYNYYVTAELPTAGTAATVIGPITFTAMEIDR